MPIALPLTIGGDAHVDKISDFLLFATASTLAMMWLVAGIGLALTIKREYLLTFVSFQTGCAYAESVFHNNEGNESRRVRIFFFNERQWRAIRDHVRQWVLIAYAAWKALMPSWFTTDLQARIPDGFMPTQALHDLNVHAPDGRRPTLMGLLRRASQHVVVSDQEPSY
jgi:hypothetical protein